VARGQEKLFTIVFSVEAMHYYSDAGVGKNNYDPNTRKTWC
jgi:hypothetical protein